MTDTTMNKGLHAAERLKAKRVSPDGLLASDALTNVLVLAILSGALVWAWVLVAEGGWTYYRTPLGIRGYLPVHRSLRPSGSIGILFGIVGTLFMISTLPYAARKRVKWLAKLGSTKGWLEFHVFCGVFGPILITIHTSFRFNGIISVAYWSMVLVVLSGFVGRYLFIRIPKTIRGTELSQSELQDRISSMMNELVAAGLPRWLLKQIEAADAATQAELARASTLLGAIVSGFASRRRLAALRKQIRRVGLGPSLTRETLSLIRERNALIQRRGHLKRTRQLFQLWHVFHRPLVWVMFVILLVHLGVAFYFGYAVLGRN